MKSRPLLIALTCAALPSQAADLDFYRDVYPFLKANCISCHNKTTTKADLNMETPELIAKGGENGPALVPGKSSESLVVKASIHTKDMEMPPPKNKSGAVNLTQAEIEILKQWIDQGAKSSVQEERQVVWQPLAASIDPIYSVVITKDGRYAACGRSNQIFVYDLATRQFVTQLIDDKEKPTAAHRALVQALAFSPDGTRLASGSFGEVKLWHREPGKVGGTAAPSTIPAKIGEQLIKKITATSKTTIVAQTLSADGTLAAAACSDGAVRVWDVTAGKQLIELRGHLAASQQAAALEWTVAEQTLEQAFQKTEVTRIEAQNKSLDELLKKANDAIVAMKKLIPEKQKAVKPTQEAKAAAQKAVDQANALMKQLATSKPDASLGKKLKDAQEKLQSATMSETSATAALSATENNVKDSEAEVKRISDTKAQNSKALIAVNAATSAAKKKQDKATADLAALKQSLAKTTTKPLALCFSPDGHRVAAICNDGTLNVWAIASGAAIDQAKGSASASATITPNADGSFTASTADGKSVTTSAPFRWVLERTLGGVKAGKLFADRVNAVRFSPDGKTLATGSGEPSRSGDISLFEVASGKLIKTWKERHTDTVLALDFSPNGKLLASGAADKIVRVCEVASGKQVNLFEGHTHYITSVAFRADGRVLASAGADGLVNAWDLLMGERKKKIEGWTKEVTSLQFIGATNQIVTSAGDNRVRIITDDGIEIRAITKLPDFMQSAASTPNGSTIVGGGEDSVLRVWDGTNGKELAVFTGK